MHRSKLQLFHLTQQERRFLKTYIGDQNDYPRNANRARVIILTERNFSISEIAISVGIDERTVDKYQQEFRLCRLASLPLNQEQKDEAIAKKAEELARDGVAYNAIPGLLAIKRDALQVAISRAYANKSKEIKGTSLTGLSGRSLLRLTLSGIQTAEALAALSKADLALIPGLGDYSVQEIENFLAAKGFTFAIHEASVTPKAPNFPDDPAERDATIYARYIALKTEDVPDKIISHQIGITLDQLTSSLQQHRRRMNTNTELSHTTLDGLSDKVRRSLAAENISSFEDLTRISEKDLKNVPNLGAKAIAEIKQALTGCGLCLAEQAEDSLAPLSHRLRATLSAHNIKTLADLASVQRSQLQKEFWLGDKAVEELSDFMTARNLRFADELVPFNPERDPIHSFLASLLSPDFRWPDPTELPRRALRTTADDRHTLLQIYRDTQQDAQRRKKATIILASAIGYHNVQIAEGVPALSNFVAKVRRRFMVSGIESLSA